MRYEVKVTVTVEHAANHAAALGTVSQAILGASPLKGVYMTIDEGSVKAKEKK